MVYQKRQLREQQSLGDSFTVLLDRLIPWQNDLETLEMLLDAGVRQILEELLHVLE